MYGVEAYSSAVNGEFFNNQAQRNNSKDLMFLSVNFQPLSAGAPATQGRFLQLPFEGCTQEGVAEDRLCGPERGGTFPPKKSNSN